MLLDAVVLWIMPLKVDCKLAIVHILWIVVFLLITNYIIWLFFFFKKNIGMILNRKIVRKSDTHFYYFIFINLKTLFNKRIVIKQII